MLQTNGALEFLLNVFLELATPYFNIDHDYVHLHLNCSNMWVDLS